MYKVIDDREEMIKSFKIISKLNILNSIFYKLKIKKYASFLFFGILAFLFFTEHGFATPDCNNWYNRSCIFGFFGNEADKALSSTAKYVGIDTVNSIKDFMSSGIIDQFVSQIVGLVHGFINIGISLGVDFISVGAIPLLLMIFSLLLVWKALKSVISGSGGVGDLFKEMITLMMTTIIFYFILANYADIVHKLIESFSYISSIFMNGGGQSSGTSASALQGSFLSQLVTFFTGIMTSVVASMGRLTGKLSLDIGSDFLILLEMLFLGFVLLEAIFALAIYVMQYFFSIVMLGIGAALGPVFIPFGVWPETKFLFDGWVKFFITMGLFRVLGALVFVLMYLMEGSLIQYSSKSIVSTTGAMDFTQIAVLYILMLILIELIKNLPNIAAEVVTGFPKAVNAQNIQLNPFKGDE